jgi:hypothetical protein
MRNVRTHRAETLMSLITARNLRFIHPAMYREDVSETTPKQPIIFSSREQLKHSSQTSPLMHPQFTVNYGDYKIDWCSKHTVLTTSSCANQFHRTVPALFFSQKAPFILLPRPYLIFGWIFLLSSPLYSVSKETTSTGSKLSRIMTTVQAVVMVAAVVDSHALLHEGQFVFTLSF